MKIQANLHDMIVEVPVKIWATHLVFQCGHLWQLKAQLKLFFHEMAICHYGEQMRSFPRASVFSGALRPLDVKVRQYGLVRIAQANSITESVYE